MADVTKALRWWRAREHGVVALASLITLALSIGFVLYRDDRNDDQLARAQCEAAAERSIIAVTTWTRITSAIPGDSDVEADILDYIVRCNPPRNCDISLVAPPVPEECFEIESPTTTTEG